MNSFLQAAIMQRMMPPSLQNAMSLVQQARQIQQNPSMLSHLLQQNGMITSEQAKDIQQMGNNYEQIGQYLIKNGKMPGNIKSYENQVSQIQSMLNK